MAKNILTTKEIARYCDVTQRTVIQWINEGKIQAFRTPGNHSKIRKEDFLKFLEEYGIPVPPELIPGDGKKRILIVDDDEAVINAIRRILVLEKDYEVESATDGFIAGQKFIEHRPDLIILDLRMPRVDGYKLCKAIRHDAKNDHVMILVLSGMVDPHEEKELIELGANDYMAKPFDNDELKTKIRNLLEPSVPRRSRVGGSQGEGEQR